MYITVTEDISLDRTTHMVRTSSGEVHLTRLEFALLDYLASHPNRLCTRDELIDHVWGSRFHYDMGTIDVHLNALRRKLGWSKDSPIETLRGRGLCFRIEKPVSGYTIDLPTFASDWISSHEVDLQAFGLTPILDLTPFVNELTISPLALGKLLDAALEALLPSAHPGVLRLSSQLTMHSFRLSLDINGTVNELRIPINRDLHAF